MNMLPVADATGTERTNVPPVPASNVAPVTELAGKRSVVDAESVGSLSRHGSTDHTSVPSHAGAAPSGQASNSLAPSTGTSPVRGKHSSSSSVVKSPRSTLLWASDVNVGWSDRIVGR